MARHEAAHQVGQLRRRAQQHRLEGGDHELFGAGSADPGRGRGGRELPQPPPNAAKAAIREAIANSPRALKTPAPDVILSAFDSSAISYRARFWIDDYERDEAARDRCARLSTIRSRAMASRFRGRFKSSTERAWNEPGDAERIRACERLLAGVDLFATLGEDQRREIASATTPRMYGDGEAIVTQGAAGSSMFVVQSGRVVVVARAGTPRGGDH